MKRAHVRTGAAHGGRAGRGWCRGWGGGGLWHHRHHDTTNHEDMTVNIYVTNLAYVTTEDELSHLFEAYGTVESVRIITDRATGRSRGFAFVEMPNTIQARVAIVEINGMELGGRTLTVQEARPRDEHDSGRREPRRPR